MFKKGLLVLSVSQSFIIVLPFSPMAMVSRTIIGFLHTKICELISLKGQFPSGFGTDKILYRCK